MAKQREPPPPSPNWPNPTTAADSSKRIKVTKRYGKQALPPPPPRPRATTTARPRTRQEQQDQARSVSDDDDESYSSDSSHSSCSSCNSEQEDEAEPPQAAPSSNATLTSAVDTRRQRLVTTGTRSHYDIGFIVASYYREGELHHLARMTNLPPQHDQDIPDSRYQASWHDPAYPWSLGESNKLLDKLRECAGLDSPREAIVFESGSTTRRGDDTEEEVVDGTEVVDGAVEETAEATAEEAAGTEGGSLEEMAVPATDSGSTEEVVPATDSIPSIQILTPPAEPSPEEAYKLYAAEWRPFNLDVIEEPFSPMADDLIGDKLLLYVKRLAGLHVAIGLAEREVEWLELVSMRRSIVYWEEHLAKWKKEEATVEKAWVRSSREKDERPSRDYKSHDGYGATLSELQAMIDTYERLPLRG